MHKLVSFNHEILPSDKPTLKAISSSSLYGKGVFTTLAIYDSRPFLWEKHWRRLNTDAEKVGVDLSGFEREKIAASLDQIISENSVSNGRGRISFFDESASKIWGGKEQGKTSLLIQTADAREPKQNISIAISPFLVNSASPLGGVKSCNYLENLLAIENARANGFDEAIRTNEKGEITSACMANVFWLKDEKLFTPSLKTGCLLGTTREFILENREVNEVSESLDAIEEAQAIFLTSSGIGIAQVGTLGEKAFTLELHELTRIINAET